MYNLPTLKPTAIYRNMARTARVPAEQDEIRKRLEVVKKEYCDESQTTMAELTGIQPAELSKILNGKKPITMTNLEKIEKGLGIRMVWLEKGLEPIRHPGGKAPAGMDPVKDGEKLRNYVRRSVGTTELARRMGVTKSTVSGYYSSTNIEAKTRNEILNALTATEEDVFGAYVREPTSVYDLSPVKHIRPVVPANEVQLILRIPVRARAGFDYSTFIRDLAYENETVEIPRSWIKKPQLKQAVIEVDGDSMETTLRAGYEVLAYLVDPSDWEYVDEVVAVVYRDQFTIKRVSDNQLMTGGALVLKSDNPLGGIRRVMREDIIQIWKVYRITKGEL